MSREVCLLSCCIVLLLTPAQPKDCTKALDVVFLRDSSPDILTSDWNLMTNLTNNIASRLRPSNFGTHVALVEFASDTTIVRPLGTEVVFSSNFTEFARGRNLPAAIYKTRQMVLNNAEGDRPEVADVMVIISHGLSDDRNAAVAVATEAKSEGIRIITVGVINANVDQLREELREIATDPDDIDHLMLISPLYYKSVVTFLVDRICKNEVEAANESLRLVGGTSNTGRLEAYVNEEWVTVCSTTWSDLNTRIACKELGFPDGKMMYSMNQTSYFRRVGLGNIRCIGNETRLLQCPHNPLFHVYPSCDHRHDVFLQCLCGDCDDYTPRDNIRLADRTSVSGRLEVFSPGFGWGGVCSNDWSAENTRVACRQLGFLGGGGIVSENYQYHTVPLFLFNVSCSGTEVTLFDCIYFTSTGQNCERHVYLQCECTQCQQLVLQSPRLKKVMTGSQVSLTWHLGGNVSSFKFLFLSRKNIQTLLHITRDQVVKKPTRFRDRINLINVNYTTIGFNLTRVTAADMGTYALYVPHLLYDSRAILLVTDFAVVPNSILNPKVNDPVVLLWDLTALRRVTFRPTNYEILLTTPATGRIPLDFYYSQWIKQNPGRHRVTAITDRLNVSVAIDAATAKDAGKYVIDIDVTSPDYPWMNSNWQFITDLIIHVETVNPVPTATGVTVDPPDSQPTSDNNVSEGPSVNNSADILGTYRSMSTNNNEVKVIALAASLALSGFINIILVAICCFALASTPDNENDVNNRRDNRQAVPLQMNEVRVVDVQDESQNQPARSTTATRHVARPSRPRAAAQHELASYDNLSEDVESEDERYEDRSNPSGGQTSDIRPPPFNRHTGQCTRVGQMAVQMHRNRPN